LVDEMAAVFGFNRKVASDEEAQNGKERKQYNKQT